MLDGRVVKSSGRKKIGPGHGWMYYARGSAQIAFLIAAFKFVEALIVPPLADEPRWLMAGVLTFKFWGAGAALGTVWLMGRVSQRLFGWPAYAAPPADVPTRHVVLTEEMRLQSLGNRLVMWWFILGFLALVMMADTGAGPIARIVLGVFGQNDWLGLEIFVLGLLVLAAPLVLLALLPSQTRFPLLASMQAAVKPPQARNRRRKRP